MSRKASRDILFKLVFELCFHESDVDNYYEHIEDDGVVDYEHEWVQNMYTDIIDKQQELTGIVAKYLKGYTVDRVFKIDLAILMLAVYELKYCPHTEVKVIANEAVELAKKYSTEKSFKFINGVIASAGKDLRD